MAQLNSLQPVPAPDDKAERLARMGEMAAAIVHEINNPLAIMNSSAEMLVNALKTGNADPATLARNADRIRDMVQRVSRIMNGLRSFACEGDCAPVSVNSLNQIVRGALELDQLGSVARPFGVETLIRRAARALPSGRDLPGRPQSDR